MARMLKLDATDEAGAWAKNKRLKDRIDVGRMDQFSSNGTGRGLPKEAGLPKGLRAAAEKMIDGGLPYRGEGAGGAYLAGKYYNAKQGLDAAKMIGKAKKQARAGGEFNNRMKREGLAELAQKTAAQFFGNLAKQAGGTQKVIMGGTAAPQPPAPPVPPPTTTVKTGARKR